ncbi:MAG: hypothetical protein QME71_04275 [Dehalococcoidia bacterium]|nr:hypothetical protein [Dehalococcoidia bacterium]
MAEGGPVRVGCYSGGRYGERPQWVESEGLRRNVVSVDAERRQPERHVFEVTLEDNARMVLYYYPHKDVWLGVER